MSDPPLTKEAGKKFLCSVFGLRPELCYLRFSRQDATNIGRNYSYGMFVLLAGTTTINTVGHTTNGQIAINEQTVKRLETTSKQQTIDSQQLTYTSQAANTEPQIQ